MPSHLGYSARPLHVDPEAFTAKEDAAPWSFSVDVFLGISNLLPLTAIVEAMDYVRRVAERRADNPRLDDDAHTPDVRFSG